MNGPGSAVSASMPRHWVMNTSSWPNLVCASRWLRATILALFSRAAVISLRFWLIMLSRVMISQSRAAACGIQSVPGTSGLVMGQGAPLPLVDDGAGVAWVGQVAAEAGEDLAESQDVSVDVE